MTWLEYFELPMKEEKTAFVVMPFNSEFNKIFSEVIRPVCEELGYEVNKADSIDSHRNILEDIVKGISDADLLIADLTTSNPNVFYEVGIAHGLGIPTYLITQDLEEVPFDLRAYEIMEYSTEFTEIDKLEEELREVGEKHFEGEIEFGSPVSDFTDVSISIQGTVEEGEEEKEEDVQKETEPERGVLEYASEAEERRSNLESNIEEIGENTSSLAGRLNEIASNVQNTKEERGRISPKKANKLAREAANEINSYTNSVEEKVEAVEADMEFVMDAIKSFIEFADVDNDDHRESLEDQKRELVEFIPQSTEVINTTERFKSEAKNLKGMNRELDKAIANLSSVLSSLINSLEEANAKAERMISLIEQEINEG